MNNRLLLNLGCGSVYHADWINLDSIPASDLVRRWDIRRPLPFADEQIDGCYASHVLEHLPKENASALLRECQRILKPRSILRLVVPDLENIARAYLVSIDQASSGEVSADRHSWMTIELIDQMVRNKGGGEMHKMLQRAKGDLRAFVVERIGLEAESVFGTEGSSVPRKLRVFHYARRLHEELASAVLWLILGSEGRAALKEGLFRRSGQIHLWMYDRISLRALLERCGYVDIRVCRADESRIENFNTFDLDTVNGRIRKPDSLFVEATKP